MKDKDILNQTPSFDDYNKFYSTVAYCQNCNRRNVAWVRKGVKLDYLRISCENCECEVKLKP